MNQNFTLTRNSNRVILEITAIKIKNWWLIFISLLLRVSPYLLTETNSMVDFKRICLFLSYILLVFVLIRNLHIKGIWIILGGTLLNFVAMLANGGFMPVSPDARLLADKAPVAIQSGILSLTNAGGVILFPEQTRLRFMTDIFPVSSLHSVFSIGDFIICVGILVVCTGIIVKVVKKVPALV